MKTHFTLPIYHNNQADAKEKTAIDNKGDGVIQ